MSGGVQAAVAVVAFGAVGFMLQNIELVGITLAVVAVGVSGLIFKESKSFKFLTSEAPKKVLNYAVYPLLALVLFMTASIMNQPTHNYAAPIVAKSGATALNSKPLQLVVHTGLKTPEEYGYKSKYSFADIK